METRERKTMLFRESMIWLMFAAISVWAFVSSMEMWKSKEFRISSCGTFPTILSGLMLLFCGLVLIRLIKAKWVSEPASERFLLRLKEAILEEFPSRVIISFLIALAYLALLPFLSYIPATLVFLLAAMFYLDRGKHKKWLILAVAVGITLAFYLVFGIVFGVRLP